MAAHQRQDRTTQPRSHSSESVQQFASAHAAGWQRLKWRQEQERVWEGHLRSLQQCIGELLITNREVTNRPSSTTNHGYRESDNEYDRNVARDRS